MYTFTVFFLIPKFIHEGFTLSTSYPSFPSRTCHLDLLLCQTVCSSEVAHPRPYSSQPYSI